jgi:hypothetical protein
VTKQPKPIIHGRDHGRGGADEIRLGLDSTENAGDNYGVHSRDDTTGPEAKGLALTATGDGGSVWKPAVGPVTSTYDELVPYFIAGNYAYWKMNDVTGDWLDSSGDHRNLTYVSQTGELRGEAGIVAEDDSTLGMYASNAGAGATIIGTTTDTLFGFQDLDPFTCIVWVKPDFSSGVGGVCGNIDNGYPAHEVDGWSILIGPSMYPVFHKRANKTVGFEGMDLSGALPLTSGTWAQLAVTYDGATAKLFVNGALSASVADTTHLNPVSAGHPTFFVAAVGDTGGLGGTIRQYKGWLDSIILADVAVDPGDISSLHSAMSGAITVGPITGVDSTGVPAGQVLVADGSGAVNWSYPPIRVSY